MDRIRRGLENELLMEEVVVFANPQFTEKQMGELCFSYFIGLNINQVKIFAEPYFSPQQMREGRWGCKNGLTNQQVEFYMNKKYHWYQMRQLRLAFEHEMDNKQIETFSSPLLTADEMWHKRWNFIDDDIAVKVLDFEAQGFDENQMFVIREGYDCGLEDEQVEFYAKKDFDYSQMIEIRLGQKHG
ncbi:MAG: hypothetical protein RR385_08550, partial [Clostridiales bacterium]